jgi:H+-translocating NAD(P) transhydrogenase
MTQVPVLEGAGSAVACIAGIGALASQKTARLGNALSMVGVSVGVIATIGDLTTRNAIDGVSSVPELALIGALTAMGAGVGLLVSDRVGPSELPQTVAAFHSLVGIAAALTAIGELSSHGSTMSTGSLVACAAAAFIGGITATGSVVAFGKLNGSFSPNPLQLIGKDMINLSLLSLCILLGTHLMYPELGGSTLSQISMESSIVGISLIAGLLGTLLTASVGGADMPVVITVLNSYSGWALCAEGFLLSNALLTSVGALIGSSRFSYPVRWSFHDDIRFGLFP